MSKFDEEYHVRQRLVPLDSGIQPPDNSSRPDLEAERNEEEPDINEDFYTAQSTWLIRVIRWIDTPKKIPMKMLRLWIFCLFLRIRDDHGSVKAICEALDISRETGSAAAEDFHQTFGTRVPGQKRPHG